MAECPRSSWSCWGAPVPLRPPGTAMTVPGHAMQLGQAAAAPLLPPSPPEPGVPSWGGWQPGTLQPRWMWHGPIRQAVPSRHPMPIHPPTPGGTWATARPSPPASAPWLTPRTGPRELPPRPLPGDPVTSPSPRPSCRPSLTRALAKPPRPVPKVPAKYVVKRGQRPGVSRTWGCTARPGTGLPMLVGTGDRCTPTHPHSPTNTLPCQGPPRARSCQAALACVEPVGTPALFGWAKHRSVP